MSIRLKTFLISVISGLIVIIFTTGIFYSMLTTYIREMEDKSVSSSFEVLDSIIKREEAALKRTSLDWAHWDETYNFLLSRDQEYIDDNLLNNTLDQLDLDFIFYTDSKGNLFYDLSNNLSDEEKKFILGRIKERLAVGENGNDDIDARSGIIYGSDELLLLSICPVTTSDENAKSVGRLVIGRYVDKDLLDYINSITKDSFTFLKSEPSKSALLETTGKRGDKYITAQRPLTDINGENTVTAAVSIERYPYNTGIRYLKVFAVLYFAGLFVILLVIGFFVNKYVFRRLKKLHRFIERIGETKDTSVRLELSGNDEYSKIANSTNLMLAELDLANRDIREMDERFRLIMEATRDGYLDLNLKEKTVYINDEWMNEMGYEGKDSHELLYGHYSKIHPECMERLQNKYLEFEKGQVNYFEDCFRMFKKSGEIIWVSERSKIVKRDEDGTPVRIVSILSNITDRKKSEEEILKLSYSDKLTGLRNRAYMEKQFEDLGSSKKKYFVIMGDVNGLKLINDALGHKEGDKLLCTVSCILKESCDPDDIISRWAGDEFVILVKGKTIEYIENLLQKIKRTCMEIKGFPLEVSVSLGYAGRDEDNNDSESVMGLAENRMYRNKLMENMSSRNGIISSLMRTLHEKNSETEEHTMRIKNMCLKLGQGIGLSQDKLDELELLALLHDIGKIGIPEHILLKPGKLTEEEWAIMKTHSEIGYRIVKSTPELSHIAEEILAHHERYDGTGYPGRLEGEAIPLLARIISIVDSYDVMTHKRIYKDAYDRDYAVIELRRCSGTQFDPGLVQEFLKLLEDGFQDIEEVAAGD